MSAWITQVPKPKEQPQKVVQIVAPSGKVPIEKAIIFDSGVLISFSMNGMLDLIEKLRGVFKGKFLITEAIKHEVIDTPMKIKRFELEALKIKSLLDRGILEMPSSFGLDKEAISAKGKEIMDMGNKLFSAKGREIHLVDIGECTCLALSRMLTEKGIPNVLAIDERTTRMLTENHLGLRNFLEKKLHAKIQIDEKGVEFFKGFKFIRSTELAYVAYKKGLVNLKNGNVLDALLYGMKFKGAAISDDEISQIEKLG